MQHLFNIEPFTKVNKRDYLIGIPPIDAVSLKITYFKLKAWELIGDFPSLHHKEYITLNRDCNVQALVFEEKLAYYKRKLLNINAFEMRVCGFGKFKHNANSYTIYAKIEINGKLQETLSALNHTFSKGAIKTPYISIAKMICEEKADKLWGYFENLKFESCFYADKITILETPTRKYNNLSMRQKADIGLCLEK